eukprot:g20950.t1
MPPQPGFNHRGHALPKKPGPAPGSCGRKTPEGEKIEAAEQWVADYVRNSRDLMTGEQIIVLAADRIGNHEGLQDYCLVRHGPGTKLASAWLTKWKRRHGFKSRKQKCGKRVRRNGLNLRTELFTSWRNHQAAMKALDPNNDPDIKYYFISADETGLWLMSANDAVVAREQEADREDQLHAPGTGDKTSVLMSISSDRRLQVEPLVMVHRCKRADRN